MTIINDTNNWKFYDKKLSLKSLRGGKLPMYSTCRYAIEYYYSYRICNSSITDYNKEDMKELIRVHMGYKITKRTITCDSTAKLVSFLHMGYKKIKKALTCDSTEKIETNSETEQIEICSVIESDRE